MADFYLILISFILFLILIWQGRTKKKEPENFPKGPRSYIPFIGGMLNGGLKPYIYFLNLSKKWGSIYAFDMGSKRTIIVNNYKDAKEMLARPEFNGRAQDPALLHFSANQKPHGILINQNQAWVEQRRFTLRNLRDFGFGKKSMESHLELEIRELIDTFKSYDGKPLLIEHHFNGPMLNSVWGILLGERYDHNDPIINELHHRLSEDALLLGLLLYFPIFFTLHKWIPGLFRFVGKYIENRNFAFSHMQGLIDTHKKTYVKGQNRDFIDRYLEEIQNEEDPNSTFYGKTGETNLLGVIHDLFVAGSETTSSLLGWTIHILALNPRVQEKVFNEINSNFGESRNPKLEDRNLLPYTNAFINEALRFAVVTALLPHQMAEDAHYKGMFFPKGAYIMFNNYACLHDPEYWGDPEVIRPERFLAEDGVTSVKHESFVPFSTGKRNCLGEPLAKDSLFLFITAIIQQFRIFPDPSKPTPREIKGSLSVSVKCVPFPVILEDRWK